MFIDDVNDVSANALIKKRNFISFEYFKRTNNKLLNFSYKKDNNAPRIIGGTYVIDIIKIQIFCVFVVCLFVAYFKFSVCV
jgi:hypothetical protein